LENREKLFRIQREVCRETELHPLVRWQFRGLAATLKSYTLDGTISRELQEKIVNFQRKQLKVEKEINPESVYDLLSCGRSMMSVKKPDNENGNSS
jgi:hypothetical protein